MIKDPIVEETRRLRDKYAKQFDYDLRRIFEDLKAKRKLSGRNYSSTSENRLTTKKANGTKSAA
jgi:hypothetical protein